MTSTKAFSGAKQLTKQVDTPAMDWSSHFIQLWVELKIQRENSLMGLASFTASHCHWAAAVPDSSILPGSFFRGRAHISLVLSP